MNCEKDPMQFQDRWELDTFFSTENMSKEIIPFIQKTKKLGSELSQKLKKGFNKNCIDLYADLSFRIREFVSFSWCFSAQDTEDSLVPLVQQQAQSLNAKFEAVSLEFDEALSLLTEQEWNQLQKNLDPSLIYPLHIRREKQKKCLSLKEEHTIAHLSTSGYHGWSQLYDTLISNLKFPFHGEMISYGQLENHYYSANSETRKEAFDSMQSVFSKNERLFEQNLNHLSGVRLDIYRLRGWESFLEEPLMRNRMTQQTLGAMFTEIQETSSSLVSFLSAKARLLQKQKLAWYDVEAPLHFDNSTIDFQSAAQLVIEQFSEILPSFSEFSKHVLTNPWVDAENRKHKKPGGFCVDFPTHFQSRIFMTYSGSMNNVCVLAHELGHAFHNSVTHELPELAQHYPMNLAETASIMAEQLILQMLLKNSQDEKQELQLLNEHLTRCCMFLMNVPSRFYFEESFYEKRKDGFVPVEEIKQLMTQAQQRAFHDSLSEYHPYFWATKLHFYFTSAPFYNFPYTFGFLLSTGLAQLAQSQENFEQHFIEFLKHTGSMSVEDLAQKFLGYDLSKPDFWQMALKSLPKQIERFSFLADQFCLSPSN